MPFLISKVNIPVSPDQEQDLELTRSLGIRATGHNKNHRNLSSSVGRKSGNRALQ